MRPFGPNLGDGPGRLGDFGGFGARLGRFLAPLLEVLRAMFLEFQYCHILKAREKRQMATVLKALNLFQKEEGTAGSIQQALVNKNGCGARYVPNLNNLCIPFRSELIHCAA
jgi:hypothetical protein